MNALIAAMCTPDRAVDGIVAISDTEAFATVGFAVGRDVGYLVGSLVGAPVGFRVGATVTARGDQVACTSSRSSFRLSILVDSTPTKVFQSSHDALDSARLPAR